MTRRLGVGRTAGSLLVAVAIAAGAAPAGGDQGKTFTAEPDAGTELDTFTVDAADTATMTRATFSVSSHVELEVDRLATVGGLPTGQTPPAGGGSFDLDDIYEAVGVTVDVDVDDTNIPDLSGANGCYSNAELTSLLTANRDQVPIAGNGWQVWAGFVTCHDLGALGIMWRTASRDGIAVFEAAFAAALKDEKILRTTAHELGHALNLYHDDGDDQCSGFDTGTTIMNQTGDLDSNWGYLWSAAERAHFDSHPDPSVEPGTAVQFCNCTAAHFCSYNGC
jgi:hypothetical protein